MFMLFMSLAFPVTFARVEERDIGNVKTCLAKLLWLSLIIWPLLVCTEPLSDSEWGHDHTRQCVLHAVRATLQHCCSFYTSTSLRPHIPLCPHGPSWPPLVPSFPASALPLMWWQTCSGKKRVCSYERPARATPIPSQHLQDFAPSVSFCLFSWIVPFGLKYALLLSPVFKILLLIVLIPLQPYSFAPF